MFIRGYIQRIISECTVWSKDSDIKRSASGVVQPEVKSMTLKGSLVGVFGCSVGVRYNMNK